jgi:hypothetical protein
MAGIETVREARTGGRSYPAWERCALAAVLLAAFLVRVQPMLALDRFGLMGYDQAAYFVGGRALTLGYFPYRDFVHIQPPGVLYFLAPFSLLGTWGFTLAKVVFAGLGALSAALIWRISRPWCGSIGAIVAGATYALYRPSISAHRYLLIEPLVTVAVLGAIALYPRASSGPRSRVRAVIAGCLFGFALTCKFFAVVPIAAFALVLLLHPRSRAHLRALVVAFGATCIVLIGPWLVIAGSQFVTQTISDQSGRPGEIGRVERLLETFWFAGRWPTTARYPAAALVIVVVALLLAWGWSRRSCVPVLAAAWATFGTAFLLLTPQFFDHYAELIAPPVAILVGGVIAAPIATHAPGARRTLARTAQVALVAVVVVGGLSTVLTPIPKPFLIFPGEYASNTRVADRLIPDGQCVISDSPEIALILPGTVAYAVSGGSPTVDPFATAVNAGTRVPIPPKSLGQFERSLSRCHWFATPRFWSGKYYPRWTNAMRHWFRSHYVPVDAHSRMEIWHRGPRG